MGLSAGRGIDGNIVGSSPNEIGCEPGRKGGELMPRYAAVRSGASNFFNCSSDKCQKGFGTWTPTIST
jgi:hypothetical protein